MGLVDQLKQIIGADERSTIDVLARTMHNEAVAKGRASGLTMIDWDHAPEPIRNVYRRMAQSRLQCSQEE